MHLHARAAAEHEVVRLQVGVDRRPACACGSARRRSARRRGAASPCAAAAACPASCRGRTRCSSFAFFGPENQPLSVSKAYTLTRFGWSSIWPTRNSCFAWSRYFLSSLSVDGDDLEGVLAWRRPSRRTCRMLLWAPLPSVSRTVNLPILSIAIESPGRAESRASGPNAMVSGITPASKRRAHGSPNYMTHRPRRPDEGLRPGDLRPARPPGAGPVHPRRGSKTSSWAWAMDDQALKVQLFRFVDTLPYLQAPGRGQPAPARVPRRGRRRAAVVGAVGREAHPAARPRRAAAGVAGPHATPSGWPASSSPGRTSPRRSTRSRAMRNRRLAFTIDLLGEATITEVEADHVQKQYLDLLAGLTPRGERAGRRMPTHRPRRPRADPARQRVGEALGALQPVRPDRPRGHERGRCAGGCGRSCALAKQTGAFVNFDMEQYSFKDTTLRIFRDILTEPEFRDWPDVGIAIQAYLTDTEARPAASCSTGRRTTRKTPGLGAAGEGGVLGLRDGDRGAERLAGAGVHARSGSPTRTSRSCTRVPAGERTTGCVPAFGSHNIRSIAHAMAVAEKLKRAAAAATSSRCSTAWPTRSRRRSSRSASGCASTRRTANCCRAWRTSCGGCWRTRRTTRSCGRASRKGLSEEVLLMNPQIEWQPRASRQRDSDRTGRPPVAHARRLAVPATNRSPTSRARRTAPRCARRSSRSASEFGKTYPVVIDNQPQPVAQDARQREPVATRARSSAESRPRRSPQANAAVAACLQGVRRAGATRRSTERADLLRKLRRAVPRSGASSWRRGSSSRPASRGARPTPTWPRPSTSATTTRARW